MTRRLLRVVLGLLALPAASWAQFPECTDCELGLWDQPEMLTNFGPAPAPFASKDIYLGIKLGAGENGITTIEFSIQGMRQADDGVLITEVVGVTSPPPNVLLGDIHGPVDTTQTTNCTGAAPCGINIAWPQCIVGTGNVALLRISFITFTTLSNKVFTVLRKFPPGNDLYPYILFTRCDPNFTKVKSPGGCYVAGWDQTTRPVNGCEIKEPAVDEATWSGMKQLFR